MQPPEGPPVWGGLELLAARHAAADVPSTTVRRVVPVWRGTSTRPVLVILPPRAKTLVPLLVPVPMAA